MTNCRVQNLKPPCNYFVDGLAKIWLLDWEDFKGYRFEKNGLYNSCRVTEVITNSDLVELAAPDMVAKYSSSGTYTHTVDSFIPGLEGNIIANLHLGTKRRYVVMFLTNKGSYHTFGYEAGATLSYKNQTSEGLGSVVSLNCYSRYPLFEYIKPDNRLSDFTNDFTNEYF